MPLVIPIGLDPVALSLGGIEIRWYGIFVAVSILVALLVARAEARRAGIAVFGGLKDKVAQLIAIGIALAGLAWLVALHHRSVAMHAVARGAS